MQVVVSWFIEYSFRICLNREDSSPDVNGLVTLFSLSVIRTKRTSVNRTKTKTKADEPLPHGCGQDGWQLWWPCKNMFLLTLAVNPNANPNSNSQLTRNNSQQLQSIQWITMGCECEILGCYGLWMWDIASWSTRCVIQCMTIHKTISKASCLRSTEHRLKNIPDAHLRTTSLVIWKYTKCIIKIPYWQPFTTAILHCFCSWLTQVKQKTHSLSSTCQTQKAYSPANSYCNGNSVWFSSIGLKVNMECRAAQTVSFHTWTQVLPIAMFDFHWFEAADQQYLLPYQASQLSPGD